MIVVMTFDFPRKRQNVQYSNILDLLKYKLFKEFQIQYDFLSLCPTTTDVMMILRFLEITEGT
jgi:hypothetical protein